MYPTMLVLRSILFNIAFYINLIGLMVFGLPVLLLGRRGGIIMCQTWARTSLWLLEKIAGLRVEFRGVENIGKGALLIAPKHQSMLETFAMTVKLDDFSYIVKKELTWIPFFGWYLAGAHQVAVDRTRGRAALMEAAARARDAFAGGRQIFIFPEGTRRPVGAPPAYKFGVAFIYADSAVPCLPVAMNTGLFWPRRSFLRRPGTTVIEFLEPIDPGLDRTVFATLLQQRVEEACDRLNEEAFARDPALKAYWASRMAAAAIEPSQQGG